MLTSLLSNEWAKSATTPLGLTAIALLLIYIVFWRIQEKPKWLLPGACALAAIVVLSGLLIAYKQVQSKHRVPIQQIDKASQTTSGPGSHNFHDTQGQITINEHFDIPTTTTDNPTSNAHTRNLTRPKPSTKTTSHPGAQPEIK